jgi:hypothetical protein
MNGKCKDCEFWMPAKSGEVFGYCNGGIPDDAIGPTLAYLSADRDSGVLHTAADFGCAMFFGCAVPVVTEERK